MELNQTSSPAPKPRFNPWLITTIVLAVALIAGGAVFVWQRSANDKAKDDLQNQINTLQNQVQQLTKIIPIDETANWKTYTNNQYGFEVKYPSNWIATEDSKTSRACFTDLPNSCAKLDKVLFSVNFRNKKGEFSPYCGATMTPTMGVMTRSITIVENTDNYSMDTLVKKFTDWQQLPGALKLTTLGGLKAVNMLTEELGGLYSIYTIKNNNIYVFERTDSCDVDQVGTSDSTNIYNQMLATFKFIK